MFILKDWAQSPAVIEIVRGAPSQAAFSVMGLHIKPDFQSVRKSTGFRREASNLLICCGRRCCRIRAQPDPGGCAVLVADITQRRTARCPAQAVRRASSGSVRVVAQHHRASLPPATEQAGSGYGSRPLRQRPCRSWNGWIAPTSAAHPASVRTDTSISTSVASRVSSPSRSVARWTCSRWPVPRGSGSL